MKTLPLYLPRWTTQIAGSNSAAICEAGADAIGTGMRVSANAPRGIQ